MISKLNRMLIMFAVTLMFGILFLPRPVHAEAEMLYVKIGYYQKPVLGYTPRDPGLTVDTGYPPKCEITSFEWFDDSDVQIKAPAKFEAGQRYYAVITLKAKPNGDLGHYYNFKDKGDLSWLEIYAGNIEPGNLCTDVIDKTNTTVSTDKRTLTVRTKKVTIPSHYTLTFDLKGHGSPIMPWSCKPSDKLTDLPEPKEDGWVFVGWYHDESFNNRFQDQFITGDKTIYARWIEPLKEVKVTGFKKPAVGQKPVKAEDLSVPTGARYQVEVLNWFHKGSIIPDDTVFEPGQKYSVKICLIPDSGYGFAEPSGMESVLLNGSNELISLYTSGWSGVDIITVDFLTDCIISFDANGGSGTMPKQIAAGDSAYKLPSCTFTAPEGKVFDKWDAGEAGSSVTLEGNMTLKALWKDAGPKDSPIPPAQVSPENPIPLASIEAAIPTRKNDKDLKCSSFSLLQAKAVPKGETSIKLSWQKVEGAAGYIIYGNKCGKKNHYVKLKTTAKTSYKQKKLQKGTYYKYIVVAFRGDQALAASKTIHVATNGGKNGNNTAVTLNKQKLTIKRKKKATVNAALRRGRLPVKNHRAVAFESSDYRIATVTSKGKIKGVKKGTCYIYAYAQNGMCAKVKVKVKK